MTYLKYLALLNCRAVFANCEFGKSLDCLGVSVAVGVVHVQPLLPRVTVDITRALLECGLQLSDILYS